jgi:hypothetical protein
MQAVLAHVLAIGLQGEKRVQLAHCIKQSKLLQSLLS